MLIHITQNKFEKVYRCFKTTLSSIILLFKAKLIKVKNKNEKTHVTCSGIEDLKRFQNTTFMSLNRMPKEGHTNFYCIY